MNKALTIFITTLTTAISAQAEDNWYVSLKGGASFPDLSQIDTGWQIDGAVGYRYLLDEAYPDNEMGLRFEFNPGFASNTHSGPGGAGELTRLMGNVLIDWPFVEWSYLYTGGGIGGAYYHLPSLGNDFVFAYQALAGIGFIVAEDVKLEIGYRFFTSNDQHMNGVTVQAPQFQCVEAGIQIEF